uniref:Ubiquitin-like domain-containing protein n=1 Tax=Romanomermis culicivorax TaxID=13658 RepID=A0A915HKH9_ROMCU
AVDVIQLKFRIYIAANGNAPCASNDIRVECRRTETIAQSKQRLWTAANDLSRSPRLSTCSTVPPVDRQRWIFGGRILSDKSRLSEYKIPNNCVVQVVPCENSTCNNADKTKRNTESGTPIIASTSNTISSTQQLLDNQQQQQQLNGHSSSNTDVLA